MAYIDQLINEDELAKEMKAPSAPCLERKEAGFRVGAGRNIAIAVHRR